MGGILVGADLMGFSYFYSKIKGAYNKELNLITTIKIADIRKGLLEFKYL